MQKMPHEKKLLTASYVEQARQQYALMNPNIEIDDKPKVSIAENGAWVASWVWVSGETPTDERSSGNQK